MALRIIKAEEPVLVEKINMCIYAQPGIGKTTLLQTAEDPLTLDFDKGIYRAPNRKDHVSVGSWAEAACLTAEDLVPYKTIGVDTAGRALDLLSADIIKGNPKAGRGDGSLTLQGYGTLKSRFSTWIKTLNTFGKDVVLICHMDEQRQGDDVIERLDVQGGSKGEIYKSVDAMGRILITNGKRMLDFSPREHSFGKNPANLDVMEIPNVAGNNYFLASLIQDIKQRMNEMSAEQQSVQKIVEEWSEAISDMADVTDFNRNLVEVKKAPRAVQSIFAKRAKDLGFNFNPNANAYEAGNVLNVG